MDVAKRYWGWLAVALLIVVWGNQRFGPIAPLVLSVLATVYFLFRVPVTCGAENRDGTRCRNNSYGLLMGCNRVRLHKWLKLKELVQPRRWREFNRALWSGTKKCVGAGVSLATIASGVAAVVALFIQG